MNPRLARGCRVVVPPHEGSSFRLIGRCAARHTQKKSGSCTKYKFDTRPSDDTPGAISPSPSIRCVGSDHMLTSPGSRLHYMGCSLARTSVTKLAYRCISCCHSETLGIQNLASLVGDQAESSCLRGVHQFLKVSMSRLLSTTLELNFAAH